MNKLLQLMDWKDLRGKLVWAEILFDMVVISGVGAAVLAWVML